LFNSENDNADLPTAIYDKRIQHELDILNITEILLKVALNTIKQTIEYNIWWNQGCSKFDTRKSSLWLVVIC